MASALMNGTSHERTATRPEDRTGILLVAQYCGLADQQDASQASKGIRLATPDGQTLTSFTSICRYLASQSSMSKQLLGSTPVERATVQDWLSFRNTELLDLTEEKLLKVEQRLQTKVYLAGLSATLADLVLFSTLYRALANIPSAQILDKYPCLFRWFDFIQHTVVPPGLYKIVTIRKPKFQQAPAAPPIAPKADKAKAADAKPSSSATSANTAKPATASKTKGKAAPAAGGNTSKEAAPASTAAPASSAAASNSSEPIVNGAQPAAAKAAKQDGSGKQQSSKQTPPAAKKAGDEVSVDMLDIRVGQIVKVQQHPNADSLYVEDIDLGEDKPRQVVSGLVKFVTVEEMQSRRVVVVTNLKPAKMRDVMSYGMVLCASNDAHDQVEPILPPEGVPVGEKISFEGYSAEPEVQLNPKKKVFEKISPDLKTSADGTAVYKDVPFQTSRGPVKSKLVNASVK